MRTSFLGRIGERAVPPADADWRNIGPRWTMSLYGVPAGARLFVWDAMALLLRGVVRWRGAGGPLDLERVAEEVRIHYLDGGTLPHERLEGGFNLVLLDAATERAILYRNLAASGNLYLASDGAG